jgi:hypothetical protein
MPTLDDNVINTIAHSNMNNIVVGNFDTVLYAGRAFIYDIVEDAYYEITINGAKSVTAYGVWHNFEDSYTICGGYSNINSIKKFEAGYIVDWNRKIKKFSHLRAYSFRDHALVTHFDGISAYGSNSYSLTGDHITLGNSGAFCAIIKRKKSGNFSHKALWTEISYPNQNSTSGNSITKSVVIGSYTSDLNKGTHGYVSELICN